MKEALPIALFRTHIAPKEQVGLSPYEKQYGMLYGGPFVYINDLFLYLETQTPQFYTMAIWAIPRGYMLVGSQPGHKRF